MWDLAIWNLGQKIVSRLRTKPLTAIDINALLSHKEALLVLNCIHSAVADFAFHKAPVGTHWPRLH